MDFAKKTLTFDHFQEEMRGVADYHVNGKVLMLPVFGEGPCCLTFSKLLINWLIGLNSR